MRVSSLMEASTIVVCVRVTPGSVRSVPTRSASSAAVSSVFTFEEVGILARHAVALEDVVQRAHALGEGVEVAGVLDRHADERGDVLAEQAGVHARGVARDDAALLELADPLGHRRLGQADLARELELRRAAVLLEALNDEMINRIQHAAMIQLVEPLVNL